MIKTIIKLVPSYWTVLEFHKYPTYIEYQVNGEYLSDKKWDELYESFVKCFGTHLMEVYSYQTNGQRFSIFIRKNFLREQKLKRICQH